MSVHGSFGAKLVLNSKSLSAKAFAFLVFGRRKYQFTVYKTAILVGCVRCNEWQKIEILIFFAVLPFSSSNLVRHDIIFSDVLTILWNSFLVGRSMATSTRAPKCAEAEDPNQ